MSTREVRDEAGASLVLFAVMLPLILLLGVISVDVGNWWVHKRHLQTQVDSAALAGAPPFVGCFFDSGAANSAIRSQALAYAGDTLRPGTIAPNAALSTTNLQVQTPDDVRVVVNSYRYWQGSDGTIPDQPGPGYGLDFTVDGDPSTPAQESGHPCDARFLDVLGTDDDAPLLWGLVPFTASPKAHAKIEIRDVASTRGMLPWAVPEIDPARVAAIFVNEFDGSVFDWQYLDANDDPNLPWSEWTTSVGQEPVTLAGVNDRTSIVILISKNDSTPSISTGGPGTLATICSQDPGLVACYAGAGQTSGVSFIHAYSGGGSGTMTSPIARQVELAASGCTAADQSAPYFTLDGGCSAGIQAVIDFGVSGDPTVAPTCALVDGMTWSAGGLGGSLGTWTGSMALPAGGGRQELVIQTGTGPKNNNPNQCPNGNNRPNNPNLGVVAAPYVADDDSGPVQYLKLFASLASNGVPVADANSVEKDNYLYTVKVGLPKPLSIANYTDPPLLLRMASPSGSQNQAFDCDKNRNFEVEIEFGCLTTYIENYRDLDGDGDKEWNNILCTGWDTGNLPPPTPGPGPSPYPADCVMTETGDKTGQLRGGLKSRFETPCVPNNWPDNAAEAATFFGPNGGGYGSDPRYVTLIITDDTAFQDAGSDPLPVKYFAGFYVTGWDLSNGSGPQSTNGCPDNDPHPIYGTGYNQSLDNGDVWGYFVDIVLFSSEGDPSDEMCEFGSDPAACIAVLVE